jgi:glycosyltransferase involved in cell wall biosynthesis
VPVLFDVQGIQSPAHGDRGIARYLLDLVHAFERLPSSPISSYLLNPELPPPPSLERLDGRLRTNDRVSASEASVYHVGSPFEPDVPLARIWPIAARELRLIVTLYDLIPEIFPEHYLADPNWRQRYRSRTELVRRADAVVTISETTAEDAIRRLGLRSERVHVVGAAVAEQFRPPENRETAAAEARAAMPWLEPEFLLYTGGFDFRKNIDRLLQGYALLPRVLRDRHQLVVVCKLADEERALLERRTSELGVGARVHFTGFVPDADLVLLYQGTLLFVFPSLYEGFGLPIAEAQACGAAVVASRSSSLVELVPQEEAQFNPLDPASIEAALERALTDDALRTRLQEAPAIERQSWSTVAERTAAVYEGLLAGKRRRTTRPRPRLACITPLPPNPSGVADYSYRLLGELAEYCRVDAFFDDVFGDVEGPPGVRAEPIWKFPAKDAARDGYDQVIYCLGNSEFHAAALSLLPRRPGVVLAHDVRLTGAYWWISLRRHPDIRPLTFYDALHGMYDGLPPSLGERGGITIEEADEFDVYMARRAIAASDVFLVHSQHAAELAARDAWPGQADKVRVVPFACPPPEEFDRTSADVREPIVATFGIVAPVKQVSKVVEAFAIAGREVRDAVLEIVGRPVEPSEPDRYLRQAEELGIADRVRVSGALDPANYRAHLASASVAVQLRDYAHGESAASVTECLAAGVPTIVTALGSSAELPDSCVVKVAREVDPRDLGAEIVRLLRDDGRRAELREAGIRYAREHSFASAAEALHEIVVAEARRRGRALAG